MLTLPMMSCGKPKVWKTYNINQQKIKILYKKMSGSLTGGQIFYVQIDEHSMIEFLAPVTYTRGIPYDEKMYQKVPHEFFYTSTAYAASIAQPNAYPFPTILYLDPKNFSAEVFQLYISFFKDHWDEVMADFNKETMYLEEKVLGLVNAKRVDFERTYSAEINGQLYTIIVESNGVITGIKGRKLSPTNRNYGIGIYVLPGNVIECSETPIPLAAYGQFKDGEGKLLTDVFTMKQRQEN